MAPNSDSAIGSRKLDDNMYVRLQFKGENVNMML
jgi:hypothetical protein